MAFDIWPLSGLGVEISMERCEIHLHLLMRWSCESHCSRLRKRMQIWGKAIRDLSMLSRHELEVTRSNHHIWCYALWQDGQPINGFPKSDWQRYADTLKIILLRSTRVEKFCPGVLEDKPDTLRKIQRNQKYTPNPFTSMSLLKASFLTPSCGWADVILGAASN